MPASGAVDTDPHYSENAGLLMTLEAFVFTKNFISIVFKRIKTPKYVNPFMCSRNVFTLSWR